MLDETVDEELAKIAQSMIYTDLIREDFESILNPFKKEQKSKSKLLLIC